MVYRDQAFSPSYDVICLLPHSPSPVSLTGDTQKGGERETKLAEGEGEGMGEGAKSGDSEKAWSSKNHFKHIVLFRSH
jgi:hypothetical protein